MADKWLVETLFTGILNQLDVRMERHNMCIYLNITISFLLHIQHTTH
ncbi:MAG: hypothetical protein PHO84_00250 [Dysgonamonadaceae bacterium]|jgi:hypothetical protein|nr:hypothetical protein [Dysgonamonadaceae bacterium]MDD4245569.1 hypothetical protein [Dysgonamonadaceae bacterium]HUI33640.1 hypothetical protein [Dysgonamonadaceae bacterium]